MYSSEKREENMLVGITSVNISNLSNILKLIKQKYNVLNKNVFVFRRVKDDQSDVGGDEYVLTFNINKNSSIGQQVIPIHRKKAYNALFTINALNLAKDQDDNVDWQNYRNCLLVTSRNENQEPQLRVINLQKVKIVNLDLL